MSNTTYLSLNDITVTPTNTINNVITKLKNLELNDRNNNSLFVFYDLKTNTLPSDINSLTFVNPTYISYKSSITYSNLTHPISSFPTLLPYFESAPTALTGGSSIEILPSNITNTQKFINDRCLNNPDCTGYTMGMSSYELYKGNISFTAELPDMTSFIKRTQGIYGIKIFSYLTISTSGSYNIIFNKGNNEQIKLYLNGFIILNSFAGLNSTSIYLNAGTYLLYIEKIASNSNNSLDITLTPSTITTPVKIDQYKNINYTLFANALNSRDSSLIAYCKNDPNLFTAGNICDTSLQNSSLLSTILTDKCFPNNNLNIDTTTKKMNTNCKNEFMAPNNNSIIKKDFTTKYNNWANSIISGDITTSNNNISSNKDALEEYIRDSYPSEIDFGLSDNIINYCENNIKDYQITSANSTLCDSIYNTRKSNATTPFTYSTPNKTKLDKSIQQIKNNYCDPNKTINNINTNNCITEYTTKNNLASQINNYCFPNNSVKLNPTTNTYDSTCKTIHNLNNLNTTIKSTLDTSYDNWANKTINNTTTNFSTVDMALNEYLKQRTPTKTSLFTTPASSTLINYCETKIGDKFSADSAGNTLCDRLYTNNDYKTDANISSSINKIQNKYCNVIVDGKVRYETDPNCINLHTTLLSDTIKTRCIPNGKFQTTDTWCKNISDSNLDSSKSPYLDIINARTSNLKTEISNLDPSKPASNGQFLTPDSYQYAIGTYTKLKNKKLSDELLTSKLFNYCENNETNYPTIPNSQCKGIYDLYKDTNANINNSRTKMQNILCQKPENILTDNIDDNTTNIYKCKSTIFDTTKNIDVFAPIVNTYCGTTNKITSDECQNYYKDIENKILNTLNLQILPPTTSSFSNKENSFIDDYSKKIELSGFENPTQTTTTQPDTKTNQSDNNQLFDYKTVGIYSDMSTEKILDDSDCNSYDWLYLLLIFIFIILIVGLFNTCMCSKKNKDTVIQKTNS